MPKVTLDTRNRITTSIFQSFDRSNELLTLFNKAKSLTKAYNVNAPASQFLKVSKSCSVMAVKKIFSSISQNLDLNSERLCFERQMRSFYLGNVFVKSSVFQYAPVAGKSKVLLSLEASRRYQKIISPVLFNEN